MGGLQIRSESCRTRQGFVKMKVELLDEDRLVQQTVMGLDDYITMLQQSRKRDEIPMPVYVGAIPGGYVDGMLCAEEGTLGLILRMPPQKHQFMLAGTKKYPDAAFFIPMPGLIYSCVVNKGSTYSFKCFAYKQWEGDGTKLFQYPFGNVSSSGNICMGTIARSKICSFMDIEEHVEKSLDGVTNSDYLEGDLCRLSVTVSQHEFCSELQGREEFPMETLLEYPSLPTVEELRYDFKRIIETLMF